MVKILNLGYSILPLEVLSEIQEAVSIAYLKGIEGRITRRKEMDNREKDIYYTLINNRVREIQDYGTKK